MPERPEHGRKLYSWSFFGWMLLPLVAGAGGCLALGTSGRPSPWAIGGYGIIQLIYVIPLAIVADRQERDDKLAGLIVGACLVFLLSAICGGMLASNI